MSNEKTKNEEVAKLHAEMAIMMANFRAIKTLNTVETKFPESKKTFKYRNKL